MIKVFKNTGNNGSWFTTSFYNKYNGEEIKRNVYVEFPKQELLFGKDKGMIDFDLVAINKDTGEKYDVSLSCFKRPSGESEPKLVFFRQKTNEAAVTEFAKDNGFEVKSDINPEELPFY